MLNIRMRTNAKINLFLRVLGSRADGYHEIETILHGINLYDEIDIGLTSSGRTEIQMKFAEGLHGEIPDQEDNIITLVVDRLIERGALNEGVRIEIHKQIPIGAGLGGGSGNAAGALVALNELWDIGLQPDELNLVAGQVGTDVPYCISGGTALATSRGDELTPLPAPSDLNIVLGMSNQPLFTRDVYARWVEQKAAPAVGSAPITLALGGGDVTEIGPLLHNDLESAVLELRPELAEKKQALIEAGALGALVTGSGPSIFGLARDEAHGREIAGAVDGVFDRTLLLHSQPECIERLDLVENA
ncbi:MAG TPA: 4-(cytidine 5'-diphospho)-2-C-methyl-D-erythritol kinase [Actinomycetota bacterium]|nr:4-(cytidine 5'-diphospho)-2-C-methyl-D-erythritol kinase [Actinomycetota bacterium]